MSTAGATGGKFTLLSFTGKTRTLHLTWVAFFISFIVWFNHAPLLGSIRDAFQLTEQQVKALLIINVALTIPARIIIGMLVDKFGPKTIYSTLLAAGGVLCLAFANAGSYEQLALIRFLLGFVGAGFVIGIRMIGEWYPARQLGLAEGIYAGWGNFGSAAAAMLLPTVALAFGGEHGWRYAIDMTGLLALIYAVVYYKAAHNTPKGSTYFKPKKSGAMEVTSKGDFVLYLVMNVPLYAALAVLAWKLSPTGLKLLSAETVDAIYMVLISLYTYQAYRMYQVNKDIFHTPPPEIHRYKFRQVAVLNLIYMVTFGSELAVVSMLPLFFQDTFGLSQVMAGLLGGSFAVIVLFARPGGGLISDKVGRKKTLNVVLAGVSVGYLLMGTMDAQWPLSLAVLATVGCALFVHAGNGAVFAMVPLIKRRMTGQIAGMVGAYGNVGAVLFLTVLSFFTPQVFFLVIAAASIAALAAVIFLLDEPKGHMVETLPDGTVQMIEVA
ncbi:MAG: MFS transporter NNP family nitrate/nitrite transporter [Gammaproteobacteria bacterium]|nr:MAG: MFS transporter NNP family nitrate/nitrite transporter [Gammaproteobacteria bacterium]TND04965.1 MAG: MFS transporter, NNP family, nitrate/nitrite transporter [Gammaproteobacteria bacterium]